MSVGISVGLYFKACPSGFGWLRPTVPSLVELSVGLSGSLGPPQLEHWGWRLGR